MAWPTTSNPRTEFVTVRFTDDEAQDLDMLSILHGGSRSTAIRVAVEREVAAEKRRQARMAAKPAQKVVK